MFRVRSVYALMLGVLLAAVAQAQPPMPPGMIQSPEMQPPGAPGPMMGGPMMGGPMMGGPMGGPMMGGPGMGGPGMGGPVGGPMGGPMYQEPLVASPVSFQSEYDSPVQPAGYAGGGCFDGGCGGGCFDGGCGGGCFDGGCGCDGGCGGLFGGHGCGGCCPTPNCVIFTHEVEASFLFMDIDGTAAAGQLDAPAIPVAALYLASDADLDSQLAATPRVWLHAQKCNWGLGIRYWDLGESESLFTPLNLLNLNIIGSSSMERIHAMTTDVEATYSFHPGHVASFQFGVGVRYAEYENESAILANAAFTDAVAHTSALSKTLFDGTGVTAGVRGTIGCGKHVAFFWGIRGSAVFGDMTTLAQTAATAVYAVDPAAGAIDAAGTVTDEELYIGEVQLGIQWEHQLRCLPATAFFRVTGEYQHWEIDSMAFSQAESIVQVDVLPAPEVLVSSAQARAGAPYVDMYGLSIAAGLTW